jgi:hypothetical protein
MQPVKPFAARPRLTDTEAYNMRDWTFSSTAEVVVGIALAIAVVALAFV